MNVTEMTTDDLFDALDNADENTPVADVIAELQDRDNTMRDDWRMDRVREQHPELCQ